MRRGKQNAAPTTISGTARPRCSPPSVIGKCMPRHRAQEFRRFLDTIEKNVPSEPEIYIVMDNASSPETKLIGSPNDRAGMPTTRRLPRRGSTKSSAFSPSSPSSRSDTARTARPPSWRPPSPPSTCTKAGYQKAAGRARRSSSALISGTLSLAAGSVRLSNDSSAAPTVVCRCGSNIGDRTGRPGLYDAGDAMSNTWRPWLLAPVNAANSPRSTSCATSKKACASVPLDGAGSSTGIGGLSRFEQIRSEASHNTISASRSSTPYRRATARAGGSPGAPTDVSSRTACVRRYPVTATNSPRIVVRPALLPR